MSDQRLLDLGVSDVHAPGAMQSYVGGYGGVPPAKGDKRLTHAALVVVRNPAGHVLTVSRPEPPHEMAIPGGLCEPGEEPDKAAMRELKEECGVDASNLSHVCDMTSPTDGRTVHVYSAQGYTGEPIASEFGTRVAWMHPNDLLGQAKQFHTSVRAIMDAGGMSMPQTPTKTAQMKEFTTEERQKLAKEGKALPDGSYPIESVSDLENAIQSIGRAKDRAKVMAHIKKRAKALGAEDKLPEEWKDGGAKQARDKGRGRHLHTNIAPASPAASATLTDPGGLALMAGRVLLLDDSEDKRVWIQLAEVGKFSGHPAGDFELSPQVFSQICANFKRDKSLPIPIDMEHASEQEPTEGSIPTTGAPAQGWIHSLDNRGQAGLFGEVEWLEPAKSYIKEGKYKYLSPAIRFESRDRVTGQPIGARLTSAAITNQPFLRNMQPLVARDGARTQVYCMSATAEKLPTRIENGIEQVVHEPPAEEEPEIHATMAHHPSKYMGKVRACLKMPDTASPQECADKLGRLRDLYAKHGVGTTPDGIDMSSYLRSMRTLSGVGVGGSWDNVFDVFQDMLDAAIDKHEIEDHGAGPQMADKGASPAMPKTAKPEGENEDAQDNGAGVDASHKSTTATDRTTETTTMSDEKLAIALRDANGTIGQLTIKLKDANHQITMQQVEIDTLRAEKATREEEMLLSEVHVAFETYKDVKKLSDRDRPHMLAHARSSIESFRAMYPSVPVQHRHLQRTVTPPAPKTVAEFTAGADGNPLTFSELTAKIQKERKMTFEDAQNEAVRVMRQTGVRAA